MSKHHIICKSKTLDVPIIITSTIDSNENSFCFNEVNTNEPSSIQTKPFGQISPGGGNKFKLDKGFSLDSHYLQSQNSLSSSSTNNDINSSSNSISSSTNSIQTHNFQFQHQQFLTPPPAVNINSAICYNINADFDSTPIYEIYQNKSQSNSSTNLNLISSDEP